MQAQQHQTNQSISSQMQQYNTVKAVTTQGSQINNDRNMLTKSQMEKNGNFKEKRHGQQQANLRGYQTQGHDGMDQSQHQLPMYQGPFNVNCTTNKDPVSVMNEIYRSLKINKVHYKQTGPFKVECTLQHPQQLTFTMELNHLEDLMNILIVKFKRVSGEMSQYRDTSSSVLRQMALV